MTDNEQLIQSNFHQNFCRVREHLSWQHSHHGNTTFSLSAPQGPRTVAEDERLAVPWAAVHVRDCENFCFEGMSLGDASLPSSLPQKHQVADDIGWWLKIKNRKWGLRQSLWKEVLIPLAKRPKGHSKLVRQTKLWWRTPNRSKRSVICEGSLSLPDPPARQSISRQLQPQSLVGLG